MNCIVHGVAESDMTEGLSLSFTFPGDASGKDPTCQCRRCKRYGFGPWVGKILQRRKWQPIQEYNRVLLMTVTILYLMSLELTDFA